MNNKFGIALVFALATLGGIGSVFHSWIPEVGFKPVPTPSAALSPLAQIVLNYNNSQAFWIGGVTTWTVPAKGVTVHEISAEQAQAIADELQAVIPKNVPMSIPLALLASESVLDPNCENGNFAGSNPTKDPMGYDDGIAQIKLKYEPGPPPAAQAQAFAFDIDDAIPYFWSLYDDHVATAESWLAAGAPSNIDPRLTNKYVLGAVLYKQGPTGAYAIFKSGVWPAELNNFVSLTQYFSKQLGEPSPL